MGQTLTILVLLGASLVALLLVVFARREATAEREAGRREVEQLRQDAQARLADAKRREDLAHEREKEVASDHRHAQQYARLLEERAAVVVRDEKRLAADRARIAQDRAKALAEVAQTTPEEARAELVAEIVDAARHDAEVKLRRLERRTQAAADKRAREILVEAMQRQAAASSAEHATTWIDLPSDEMKGRIIGREGRNIRAFEALTGVTVLVEEGVDAVQLSSFDPERREIAEVTLNALVEDGRIQPQRVEAAYARAVAGAFQRHRAAGLDALTEAGVSGVPSEIVDVLGKLRLRTSYGQNVLAHLVETSQMAADIAAALGADVDLARRGALFHDLGKAFTHEQPGTHAALGARFLAEHGEDALVVNAVSAHHDEVPQESLEAVIVQVADALSAARPGARREDLDSYINRMENLEKLVLEHHGVTRVLAMAAGREVRVIVEPEEIDDEGTQALARTIAEHISKDFTFPGEIKVTVIRELRADAVAG
ncbi:ribonuclease Y [Demequina sp. SYSU T00192]|uniref:Ribonuclease Y n=1 Tax=Demequina litoralis TaxID=3051660 RepID=A0ABT8GAR8_9MICO|nr:ribonuclease Y [Demequina sp. SYSU T00192]MDN4476157.1 ribonuclease Y [Demequina sp. SYSU T00192]